ncbi:hypothetical protein A4H02_03630 [Fervidobacterium thailandense]|uniref:Uncharacterized protein n=1 Tax=Fervidobacterium thailandense TaxID=1008305 RepID=A0A1E3G3A1_9BACT|nr:hypothetical protein A4H02_03630 [Fervidobacterium thailandense]
MVNCREAYESYDSRLKESIERNISYIDYSYYKMRNFKHLRLLNPFEVYKIRPIHDLFSQAAYCVPYEIESLDADGVVRRIPVLTVETRARKKGISSRLFPHMNVIAAVLYSRS